MRVEPHEGISALIRKGKKELVFLCHVRTQLFVKQEESLHQNMTMLAP